MKTFLNTLRSLHQSRTVKLAASLVATITLAGSVQLANATPLPTYLNEKPPSITLNTIPTQPELANQLTLPVQTTQMSMEGLVPIVILGGLVIFVPMFFSALSGLVVISEREVGIVVKK